MASTVIELGLCLLKVRERQWACKVFHGMVNNTLGGISHHARTYHRNVLEHRAGTPARCVEARKCISQMVRGACLMYGAGVVLSHLEQPSGQPSPAVEILVAKVNEPS